MKNVHCVFQEPTAREKGTHIQKIVHNVQEESIMIKMVNLSVKIALLGRMELSMDQCVLIVFREPTAMRKVKVTVQNVQ